MTRDPLYQHILVVLNGDLDDKIFERCAADMLRDVYPTLVPMTGGDDGGYDGAVGTPEGPFVSRLSVERLGGRVKSGHFVDGQNRPFPGR